jgi:hypothetical protein
LKENLQERIIINGIWYHVGDKVILNRKKSLTIKDTETLIDQNSNLYQILDYCDQILPIITDISDDNNYIVVHKNLKYFFTQ